MHDDNEILNPRQHLIIVKYNESTDGNMWKVTHIHIFAPWPCSLGIVLRMVWYCWNS